MKTINPNITSKDEFHIKYSIIIIPLILLDKTIIIIDIIKKKLSKHIINLNNKLR